MMILNKVNSDASKIKEEILEDEYLLNLAKKRMKNKPSVISEEEFYKRNGIDDDFLNNLPDIDLEWKILIFLFVLTTQNSL